MEISERMAKARAEWRTAKNLFREARNLFNTAVDAHRDDEQWSDALRQEIAALHTTMEATKRNWIASDESIHNGRKPDYV